LLKGAGPSANTLASAQAAVGALDSALPVFGVTTLESATSVSLLPVKVAAIFTGALGALALVLGAIGLYGVMAAIAQQRTREIGIRMALGAQAGAVVRLVTSNGMRWTAIGIGLGMAAAFGVASAAAGFLYGVRAFDPAAFATIPVVLAAAAYTACYLPARRASRLDPLRALRDE
jgi:putative ABC transport system permease protein